MVQLILMKQQHSHSKFLLHKYLLAVLLQTKLQRHIRISQIQQGLLLQQLNRQHLLQSLLIPLQLILKSANRTFVDIGDIITYTISLQNTGTVSSTNIVLTDPIPNGTTFILNSVTIDGVSQPNSNPENGISIGTLNPNQAKQLHSKFKLQACHQMAL